MPSPSLSLALFGGSAITFFFLVGFGVCGIAVIVGDRLGFLDGGGLGESVGWDVNGRLNTSKRRATYTHNFLIEKAHKGTTNNCILYSLTNILFSCGF